MANFIQKVFNAISLQRDEKVWLSTDDSLTEKRLKLLAEFSETQFAAQLKLDCVSNAKNGKLSSALREKGNLCYAQGDCESALRLYNQSLEFAIKPKSSEADEEDLDDVDVEAAKDMALAFANRSAVWSDRGEFALAIRDADLAFDAAYPDELKHKLFERKGQCLVGLGKTKEAKAMLQKAVEYLAKSNIKGAERKKAKEKTLEKLISDLLEDANVAAEPAAKMASDLSIKYVRKLIPDLQGDDQHPKFPNFSSAIKVEYDPKGVRGRYCVASRTIEPGELLAVETPYVWLLDKEAARIHCWHCFRPVLAPVPCFQCAGLVFCGPDCRAEANKSYHPYECGITDVIHHAQIGGWALAYRAVTSNDLEYFLNNRDTFMGQNEQLGSTNHDNEVYDSANVLTFHNLVTHKGRSKQAPELMMQSLAAMFLLRCLKAKKYYISEPDSDPKCLTETELYLAKVIHHFMRVTYFNTHEITTTDEDTEGVGFGSDRLAMRRIGRATNPTLALLNHSCDPNYRRISVGRQTLGFATKFIEKGEEITDTYCPTFAAVDKAERHQSLSKYNFECACLPCVENWPTIDQLPRKFHGLPQQCYKIDSKEKIKLQMKRISTADHVIAKIVRDPKPDLNKLLSMAKRHYEDIIKLVHAPHHALTMAENRFYYVLLAIFASKTNIHYMV